MTAVTLDMLGWNERLAEACRALGHPDWYPARIIRETKINFTVIAEGRGDHEVVLSGKLWHDAATDADLPTVGDWVAVDPGQGTDLPVIRALLPRSNRFSRKAPGRSSAEQVIGANIDVVIVVTDPGSDYNLRRLERYLTLIRKSGARPVILINKADTADAATLQQQCREVAALGLLGRRQEHPRQLAARRRLARDGQRQQRHRQRAPHHRRARTHRAARRRHPHRQPGHARNPHVDGRRHPARRVR